MGLLGHMRIHESGSYQDANTSYAPIYISSSPPMSATTSTSSRATPDSASPDLSYPLCHRRCTSRIGLVGHFQIHRTESGEPVPGAPTYTRHTRLNCPHCPRTFTHHMGLLGHMRLHENQRWNTAGYTKTLNLSSPASAPHMITRNTTKNMLSVCITV
ncbi:unnamed protein product [Schistocephalus solidus]|uniref:C2H2-type domain-containing protein n=1 Tax=Schistocephalus solidus TaxID=70667 RepID=A0A183TA63_SCHSO|nr:unnamed protein product [Schistocephalus solidus]